MEYHLKDGIKADGQLKSIEKRTSQLWMLATIVICLLGTAVVVVDIALSGFSPSERILGINREFYRIAIVLCILLVSAYFREKVHELRQVNAYLVTGLQHYARSLERRNEELHSLNSLSRKLIGSVDIDSGLQTVLEVAMKAIHATRGSILLVDRDSSEFVIKVASGFPEEIQPGYRFQARNSISSWIARHGEPIVLNNARPDARVSRLMSRPNEVFSSIGVPLKVAGETVGVMNVSNRSTREEFSDADLEVMTAFSDQAATLIERTQLYSQLRNHVEKLEEALQVCDDSKLLSTSDPLTGLGNRRYFDYLLEAEYQRSRRYGRPLCLIRFDLDNFKGFNDLCGHAAGDLLLKRLGQLVRSSIRSEGSIARCGGDEFSVVLPECEHDSARIVAERLRMLVERASREVGGELMPDGISASFGIACFPMDAASLDELTNAADSALNEAKRLGKNRVLAFGGLGFAIRPSEG